jgi:uncharacterized protein with HEPN domain
LSDALAEARFARDLVSERGAETVANDPVARRALERACEIVGEALRAAIESEPGVVADYPGIPWKKAIGLRTRLAHAYDRVDIAFLIDAAKTAFPELIEKLENALA